MTPELTTVNRAGAWWILGMDDGPIGPYSRRADADDDRRGLLRFAKFENRPGYVTIDKPQTQEVTK